VTRDADAGGKPTRVTGRRNSPTLNKTPYTSFVQRGHRVRSWLIAHPGRRNRARLHKHLLTLIGKSVTRPRSPPHDRAHRRRNASASARSRGRHKPARHVHHGAGKQLSILGAGDGTPAGAFSGTKTTSAAPPGRATAKRRRERLRTTGVWASATRTGTVPARSTPANPPLGSFVYWNISAYGHVGIPTATAASTQQHRRKIATQQRPYFNNYRGWTPPRAHTSKPRQPTPLEWTAVSEPCA